MRTGMLPRHKERHQSLAGWHRKCKERRCFSSLPAAEEERAHHEVDLRGRALSRAGQRDAIQTSYSTRSDGRWTLLTDRSITSSSSGQYRPFRSSWETNSRLRRRREFCQFADTPSQSQLKRLLKGEGGAAE